MENMFTPAADERLDRVNENILLLQKKKGLSFGTDAFLLSAFLRPAPKSFAVEFGCGTGIVSLLAAARHRFAKITAIELQESMAELAKKNVENNGFSDTVSVLNTDIRKVTSALLKREADAVFANPPYMKTENGKSSPFDEKQISRHETAGGIEEFALAAAKCLKYGGSFYTVYRPDRLDSLFSALQKAGFAAKRMLFAAQSPDSPPFAVLTEAKLHGAEGLTLLPTLILHESKNETALTPRARQIYDTGLIE